MTRKPTPPQGVPAQPGAVPGTHAMRRGTEPGRVRDEQARADDTLRVLQWQNKKAVLRTNKRALPVVQ